MKQRDVTTFAAFSVMMGIACTTLGHYAENWGAGYMVALFSPILFGLVFAAGVEP